MPGGNECGFENYCLPEVSSLRWGYGLVHEITPGTRKIEIARSGEYVEDLNSVFKTHIKKLGILMYLDFQHWRSRDRQIPQDLWLPSLAYYVRSRPEWKFLSKKNRYRWHLWLSFDVHTGVYTLTCEQHTHHKTAAHSLQGRNTALRWYFTVSYKIQRHRKSHRRWPFKVVWSPCSHPEWSKYTCIYFYRTACGVSEFSWLLWNV